MALEILIFNNRNQSRTNLARILMFEEFSHHFAFDKRANSFYEAVLPLLTKHGMYLKGNSIHMFFY